MIYYQLTLKYPLLVRMFENLANWSFGIFRFFIPRKKDGKNVVIISLHKMGDSIYTIPSIARMVDYYKEKAVVFTFPENVSIYKLVFPGIKYVTVELPDFMFSGRVSKKIPRKKLRELDPAVIIDITGSIRGASIIFNSKAKIIAGINERPYRNLYDNYVPIKYKTNLTDIYTNAADALNIPPAPVPKSDFLSSMNNSDGSVLIFPLAGWKQKEWGINNFISLAKRLSLSFPVSFIIPRGGLNEDILYEIKREGFCIIETSSIDEMIDEIKKYSFIICNDSGPSHVAELLGKKVITIFGPTNPDVHKKSSDISTNIINIIKCSPVTEKLCFANGGKDCPSNECLLSLSVEKVFSQI